MPAGWRWCRDEGGERKQVDGYRGREDARARTTEKDEVEELESGAHEMKARGVREREREKGERKRM